MYQFQNCQIMYKIDALTRELPLHFLEVFYVEVQQSSLLSTDLFAGQLPDDPN